MLNMKKVFKCFELKNKQDYRFLRLIALFWFIICFSLLFLQMEADEHGMIRYVISVNNTEQRVRPEDIGSTIIEFLKNVAVRNLTSPVTKVVMSVPAEFDQLQRNYTRKAANNAGRFSYKST